MEEIKNLIEKTVKDHLKGFQLSKSFGQRSVGDKIEDDCAMIFENLYPDNYIPPRSKKSTEDFSLSFDGIIFYIDVKTHFIQEQLGFSMPNLVSISKLKTLLEEDSKSLLYIFVDYKRSETDVTIESVTVKFIWDLDWSILGIGSLGKGQLQIKNANKEMIFTDMGKQRWNELLKQKGLEYNQNQIRRIQKEIDRNWT
jgi:hypothetical protein